ncbi:PREDICTED: transcription factor MYB114-like [Nelumbo nucifera]|uniref:Transcription factor MYB114-like n=2 Tax=Nelumbo nucifera TaxID=4432 RepID=A0A1U7ZHH6_NELNU|nr:PREDICTED: transcription factor MYB114-like [Nelumbo nucifera]DAD35704.1 TPA_asm: hypothetical protein HUJ06_006344 [Nelumbo nucifera]
MLSNPGLRKGSWTEEEDILLRECIEKYGEGKWHRVPVRAGLKRCRKSCRLRWLNYLKPDIKRGQFTADEVDLITRLHKLLGNRWSLIAGRLPGRTANDIKNYCNTRMRKNKVSPRKEKETTDDKIVTQKTKVFRPRPLNFCKNSPCFLRRMADSTSVGAVSHPQTGEEMPSNNNNNNNNEVFLSLDLPPPTDEALPWWKSILAGCENEIVGDNGISCSISGGSSEQDVELLLKSLWAEEWTQKCWS